MAIALRLSIALFATAVVAALVAGLTLPRPAFDATVEGPVDGAFRLAPDALTFARTTGPSPRVLLVVGLSPGGVAARDLTGLLPGAPTDPIDVLGAVSLDALARLARGRPSVELPWSALGLPLDLRPTHVAAGTNFSAHAEEVGLDGDPFLFPKRSAPTPWNAPVDDAGRLDYEAELCAVTLARGGPEAPLGFLVCNDFTDRATLLVQIDLDAPMGVTAFTDAKGGDDRLPVGPLLVVPADADAFLERVTLQLSVDGDLRQRADAALMIWRPDELIRRALDACETDFETTAGPQRLAPCDALPARTLLLTGTGAGVRFHPLNIWNPRAYLNGGDRVLTSATHLGVLDTPVH